MNVSCNKPGVIIVVEDEALIRMILVEMFTEEGFEVLEARHAADALSILGAEGPRVDAIFTDVNMPGEMGGIKLAHNTKKHWPWVRAGNVRRPQGAVDLPRARAFHSETI